MYTRCKGCHTVHPVNASLLARDGGNYRCGKCKKTGNALEALFDEWPQPGDKPPKAGQMPDLGLPIDLDKARTSRSGDADTGEPKPGRSHARLTRLAWIGMLLVVVTAVTFELSDYFGKPLLEAPAVKTVITRLGIAGPLPESPYRDLSQIHLVSRDLRSHPLRAGMLQLTATIVNRSVQAQPYPDIEVVLFDASGQAVSQELFHPADYLSDGTAQNSGMTPEAYLPLVLDLTDPGSEAVGFELNFL